MKRVLIVMALLSASLAHFRAHPETQTLTQRYADVSISELSSKTVKRMLVSNDGKMLYILAHDSDGLSNPIVLIYDHANKTVLRQLDLSNCATGTYVISKLSDIAVTSDGSLAGCNRYKKHC